MRLLPLFFLLLALPLIEIALFVLVGSRIGILSTIGVVLGTAMAGVLLVRRQGLQTLSKARHEMEQDRPPAGALGEGLAILGAGILLLVPGFLTDALGFLLLIPPLRRVILAGVWHRMGARVVSVHARSTGGPRGAVGPVIEGEAVEVDPGPPGDRPNGSSPWRGR